MRAAGIHLDNGKGVGSDCEIGKKKMKMEHESTEREEGEPFKRNGGLHNTVGLFCQL